MNALISTSEVDSLLRKTTPYSQSELMQLASFSCPSLADRLSDLSYSEQSVVQRLEGINLFNYLNACDIAIGADEKRMALIMSSPKYASMISALQENAKEATHDKYAEAQVLCICLVKMIVSRGDIHLNVTLEGKVPQKLFSFRQITADDWLNTTIDVYARIIGRVLGLNGIQDARSTLFMQCAWHMHHSQPNKYPLSIVEEENVLELFQQFVIEYGN